MKISIIKSQNNAVRKTSFTSDPVSYKFSHKKSKIINEKIISLGNEFLRLKFRKSLNVIKVFTVIIRFKFFRVHQHQWSS